MKWALGFLLAFLIVWGLVGWLTPWDREIILWSTQIRSPFWNRPVAWLTNLGSINILGPLAVLASAGLFWQKRRLWALAFLGTIAWYPLFWPLRLYIDRPPPEHTLRAPTEGILYTAESHIERVPERVPSEEPAIRPSWKEGLLQSLKRSMGRSFPSTHAAVSAYFYGLWLLWAWVRRSFFPLLLLFSMIILIGFSRVYLAVHFPTDVIAAWCLAAAVLALLSRVLGNERIEWILEHPQRRQP